MAPPPPRRAHDPEGLHFSAYPACILQSLGPNRQPQPHFPWIGDFLGGAWAEKGIDADEIDFLVISSESGYIEPFTNDIGRHPRSADRTWSTIRDLPLSHEAVPQAYTDFQHVGAFTP